MLIAARLKISERRALPGGLAAVADAEPREVRLQARDEALIELPVVADLRAADDSLAAQADAGGEAAVRVEVWEPAGEGGGGAGVGEVGARVGRPLESAAHADMHAVPGHMIEVEAMAGAGPLKMPVLETFSSVSSSPTFQRSAMPACQTFESCGPFKF